MTMRRGRLTFDDLLAAVSSLAEQAKVLIAAVGDLRCEVEWQAKQIASPPCETVADSESSFVPDNQISELESTLQIPDQLPEDSLLTAAGRLRSWEQLHSQGLRGNWSDVWAERDDFEMPVGRVIAMDVDTWSSVLDIRPAHVVGEGCCCEEGEGAPYLLAWQRGEEFFLRELTDEEARRLQILCLACQAEQVAKSKQSACEIPTVTQLGLF